MTHSPQAPWPMKALRRLVTIRSSNVDKIMEEGEEIVRLCNYVDVYYNDRITGDIEFSEGSAKPQEITKFGLRTGDVVITKDSETPDDIAVPALVDPSAEGIVCGYHLAILRPYPSEIIGPFLFWSLKAKPTCEAFGLAAQGVTRYGLTLNGIGSVNIPVPGIATQKAIAAFLDRETARIDKLIAKKERQVELLHKRAKQAVAELVTGATVEGMATVETGLDHIPRIPAHWSLLRAGHLFHEVAEPNTDDLPVLSVSIHTGISDRQLDDEERDRKVNLIEDRSSYKCVRPGYLAYNMMRAWQGAVGVSTVDGAVSPAYVVAKPTRDLHSLYYQFLLRTPPFIEQMRQGSKGITDFRLRLYWEQFRLIMLPVPPLEEQRRIAAEAERELAHADEVAARIVRSVALLREHRAALITAAVAGQIDIRENLPAAVSTSDRDRFRLVVGAEIIHQHRNNPKFGRVKLQKELYLAEAHLGIGELQGNYFRQAAGPLDRALIEETERAVEAAGFYRASQANGAGTSVTYAPLPNAGRHSAELKSLLGPRADALGALIALLRDFGTEAVEAVATLYAVWNDALMDGRQPDDSTIVNGVLTEWHAEKGKKFKDGDLRHWLDWMKRNGLTPRGQGPRTARTMTRDLFA
jgi:restriction endonuclease S subunit